MSEQKQPTRTMEQIQADYGQLCAKAGQCQYQIHCLEAELKMLNDSLRSLNMEAASVPKPAEQPQE